MEVLNETVYDSDDLAKVVEHARKKVQDYNDKMRQARNWGAQAVPPAPEKIRFGYYNNPKGDEERQGRRSTTTRDVGYVSFQGSYYRGDTPVRIGLPPATKLPLPEMLVIALAASDKDQRTLPDRVMLDLILVLIRGVFHGYVQRDEETDAWLIEGCPSVRYGFEADPTSAAESRDLAAEHTIERLRRRIKWAEESLVKLEKKQVEEREKLEKMRARLAKLENKQKGMSYVGSQ
jgi:hypothetical protein